MTISPERVKRKYAENLHEPVTIRRITGSGSTRTDETYASMGRVFRGDRKELVSGIVQQDYRAIVNAAPLFNDGLPSDVVPGDYLIDMDGIEYSVTEVKPRRVEAVMIAYDLTLRGP